MISNLFCFLFISSLSLQNAYVLKGEPTKKRFDLSGLLLLSPELKEDFKLKGYDFLLINDKTSWVYKAKISGSSLEVEKWIKVNLQDSKSKPDFEDIDTDGENIYVLNEPDGAVVKISPDLKMQWTQWKMPEGVAAFTDWFGAEAMAFANDQIWIFREMPPLDAFVFERSEFDKIVTAEQRPRNFSESQTAARFRDGKWFLLDRNARCVWESASYAEKGKCHSFSKWVDEDEHYRFEVRDDKNKLREEWSTAEALDVDADSFWVGLDNNGLGLYRDPTAKNPVILQLARPK
ncbi:MAG: hypothetical protein ACO3LE_08880 [Bdellovibrionota bacterium]